MDNCYSWGLLRKDKGGSKDQEDGGRGSEFPGRQRNPPEGSPQCTCLYLELMSQVSPLLKAAASDLQRVQTSSPGLNSKTLSSQMKGLHQKLCQLLPQGRVVPTHPRTGNSSGSRQPLRS